MYNGKTSQPSNGYEYILGRLGRLKLLFFNVFDDRLCSHVILCIKKRGNASLGATSACTSYGA